MELYKAPTYGPHAALPCAVHRAVLCRVRTRTDGHGMLCVGGAARQRCGIFERGHGCMPALGRARSNSLEC